jgi:hypothetical protein
MLSTSVAARIWAKTVFLNAFFTGMFGLLTGEMINVFVSIVVLIGGFILTLPLLMIITPLVAMSARLPYNIPAKSAWLTFFLSILIVLFYWLLSNITNGGYLEGRFWIGQLAGTTIGGLLIAVLTTRRSLNKLYTTA